MRLGVKVAKKKPSQPPEKPDVGAGFSRPDAGRRLRETVDVDIIPF